MSRSVPFSPCPSRLALTLVVISLAACGPTTVPSPFQSGPASPADSFDPGDRDPDEITREEIVARAENDLTAMAVIRRLRPGWLSPRGQASFVNAEANYPLVYIDEVRHGGLPTLHRIPSAEIHRLEFIGTTDATIRWGTGHTSGVINVVTGRF